MRRSLSLFNHSIPFMRLLLGILFLLSMLSPSFATAPFFKKSFVGQTTPLSMPSRPKLIPDNFRFSQKKNLLGRLYVKLQKVRSKENARQLSDAIEQLWLTSGSDQVDRLMSHALLAIEDKDYPKAVYVLGKIIELKPSFTEAWNKRAMVYFMAEDYKNAMLNLQKVLTLDPRHFQALSGMANILKETGHKKSALKAYEKLLTLNPHLQSAKEAVEVLSREVKGQDT